MASLNPRVCRDTLIWAAILAGHGLLLVIVLRIENQARISSPEIAGAGSFVWLSLSPPIVESVAIQPVPVTPRALHRARQPESPLQIQPITAPVTTPRVDWSHEAAVSGAAIADAEATAASKPGTFSPPPRVVRKPCQPKKSSMEWKEPRVGMAGSEGGLHLPFVAVGKRCVIGLGFFGCNLGELPEPNSHLLDDMHDPDRSRSSIPAVDSCE
jgi:hypothetical protein